MSNLIRIAVGQLLAVGAAGALSAGTYVAGEAPRTLTTTLALRDVLNTHAKTIVVYQRKAGTEGLPRPYGRVVVMYEYTGSAPVNPQVRVLKEDGSEAMAGWIPLTNLTPVAAGVACGVIEQAPQGMTYHTELRDGDQPSNPATSSLGSGRWGVGVVGVWGGQSNMNTMLNVGAYNVDKPPGSSLYEYQYWDSAKVPGYYYGVAGWAGPGYNNGSTKPGRVAWLRILTAKLKGRYGHDVPVALIPWAYDSTSIDAFLSPSGLRWTELMQSGVTSATHGLNSPKNYIGGDFEFMVWHQGENDRGGTRAAYRTKLGQLCSNMLAHVGQFGRTAANFGFFPAMLGVYAGSSPEHLRGAVLDFEADAVVNNWPHARIGLCCIDMEVSSSDGLHFRSPDAYWGNRRFLQTVLHFLGCATYSGRGPQISGVARQGDNVIVTVAHCRAGAALVNKSGGTLTGWYVHTHQDFGLAGAGTEITNHTVAITGTNQITITLPAGTGPVWIKHCGHKLGSDLSKHPDVTNLVYDDSPYTEGASGTDLYNGFPLMATPDAWAVTAGG